jgi:hypothetical protein
MNPAVPVASPPERDPGKRLVLFHRDLRAFTGGHLKVWDYFNHVASSPAHQARVAFSAESKWDATNPWFAVPQAVGPWDPSQADILFLAGTDWRVVPVAERMSSNKPIINLIQHPRHAQKKSELRGFLKNRAIRICVSQEVATAINATGEVNGPVFVIPNGIDSQSFGKPKPFEDRGTDVLICGFKAPDLAREVYTKLAGKNRTVRWLIEWVPRTEYLAHLRDAKITVFLPRPIEGFYLPALEGMACETIVVCPDCEGNRGFCQDHVNCFRPAYGAKEIISAALEALQQTELQHEELRKAAHVTVGTHSLERERASFRQILDKIDNLWSA